MSFCSVIIIHDCAGYNTASNVTVAGNTPHKRHPSPSRYGDYCCIFVLIIVL